jgi:TIR domain
MPDSPSTPTRAVFLSYAREDSDAARRIADALRAFGIEAWFDQSELRGGDAWDQKIRRQIKECALFIPIVSAKTQARPEGYFRLEWSLAEARAAHFARGVPFILPVAVDDTREDAAAVPESFQRVQWMRLPGGVPSPQFVEQVQRLIQRPGGESGGSAAAFPTPAVAVGTGSPFKRWAPLVAAVVVAAAAFAWWKSPKAPAAGPAGADAPSGPPVVVLMDTQAPDRVYDPATRKDGGTNADDITEQIRDLPITIIKENVGWLWRREREVVKENPVLIVMHRSCFYTFANTDPRFDDLYPHADDKLVAFLGYVGTVCPRTKFIIYSRHSWESDAESKKWRDGCASRFPVLEGRIETWRVPLDRATFRNPLTGQELKSSVEKALSLKVTQAGN